MLERFTEAARRVVTDARREAREGHYPYVGTEHLLLALTHEESGPAAAVLREAGLTPEHVRSEIARIVGSPRQVLGPDDAEALRSIGIDLEAVVASVEQTFGPGALEDPEHASVGEGRRGPFGGPRFTPRAKKVLELTVREAIARHSHTMGTEHLLLGLIREGKGVAAQILAGTGTSLKTMRARLDDELRRAA